MSSRDQKKQQIKRDNCILRRLLVKKTFQQLGLSEQQINDNYLMKLSDDQMNQISFHLFQEMVEAQKKTFQVLQDTQLVDKISVCHDKTSNTLQTKDFVGYNVDSMEKTGMPVGQPVTNPVSLDQYLNIYNDQITEQQDQTIVQEEKTTEFLLPPIVKAPEILPPIVDVKRIKNQSLQTPTSPFPISASDQPKNIFQETNFPPIEEVHSPKFDIESIDNDQDDEKSNKNLEKSPKLRVSQKKAKMKRRNAILKTKEQQEEEEKKLKLEQERKAKKRQREKLQRQKQEKALQMGQNALKNATPIAGFEQKFSLITKYLNILRGHNVSRETLSYKKLHKMIVTLHPTDPETYEKLDLRDSITVNKYALKLVDAIGCLYCFGVCKKLMKFCKSLFAKKEKKLILKPDTMKDVPDSDSDSEANDTFKGLSSASIYLGEGAVMYLQMMKTLAVLFFLLTIINIPIYVMYSSMTVGNAYSSVNKVFQYFTIGNIGKGNALCDHTYIEYETARKKYPQDEIPKIFDNETEEMVPIYGQDLNPPKHAIHGLTLNHSKPGTIDLKCSDENSYIQEIMDFGFLYLLNTDENHFTQAGSICNSIEVTQDKYHHLKFEDNKTQELRENYYNEMVLLPQYTPNITKYNIDSDCNKDTMFRDDDAKAVFSQFLQQECLNKNTCKMEFENLMVSNKSEQFSSLISDRCYDRIYNREVTSIELIMAVKCMNDLVHMPFTQSEDYAFHKVHLGTFAVLSDILGIFIVYYLFNKLKDINTEYQEIMDNNIIKMSKFAIRINNVILDKTTQDPRILKMKIWLHFTKLLEPHATEDNKMEVADVQISNTTAPKYFLLIKMQEFQSEMEEINSKNQSGTLSHKEMAKSKKDLDKLKEKINRFKVKYDQILEDEQKQNKAVIHISKHSFLPGIDYVWVVFKNNETPKTIYKLFEKEHPVALLCRSLLCIHDELAESATFEHQELQIETQHLEPDQIIWQNLKYTRKEQKVRQVIVFVISIVVAIISLLSTLAFIGFDSSYSRFGLDCSEIDIANTRNVFNDQVQFMNQKNLLAFITPDQEGPKAAMQLSDMMICYCSAQTNDGLYFWLASSLDFEPYNINEDEKLYNYCYLYVLIMFRKQLVSICKDYSMIIINGCIASIFESLGHFLVVHTTIEQTLSSFKYIIILEYFNMSFIILLQSFDPTGIAFTLMGQDPQTAQTYNGFNSSWYSQVGKTLCFSIFMSSMLSNLQEIKELIKILAKRFLDRGFKLNIKHDQEDEDDDEPNSKQITQEDLEELYTGDIFVGEQAYSRMISILMVSLTYSSGMPIMYFVGFCYFFITFLVNKTMLFKYYQKTNTLSRVIPNFSLKFLNVAIFVHMLFGCIMFTNPSLFETYQKPKYQLNLFSQIFGEVPTKDELDQMTPAARFFRQRVMYFHQQLYIVFVVLSIVGFVGGKFVWGLLMLVIDQIKSISRWLINKFVKMMKQLQKAITNGVWSVGRACCKRQVEQFEQRMIERQQQIDQKKMENAIMKQIDLIWFDYDRDMSGSLDKEEARDFISDLFERIGRSELYDEAKFDDVFNQFDEDNSESVERAEMMKLIKVMLLFKRQPETEVKQNLSDSVKSQLSLESAEDDQENQEQIIPTDQKENQAQLEGGDANELLLLSKEEKQRQEKIMARFKQQILKPYISENMFMDLDIVNLQHMYDKAKRELKAFNHFFNIRNPGDSAKVLTPPINRRVKKRELRIVFEELCYTTKLTYREVQQCMDMLAQRVIDIEAVIDHHFDLIRGHIYNQKAEKLEKSTKKPANKESPQKGARSSISASHRPQNSSRENEAESELHRQIELQVIKEKLESDPELQFDNKSIYTYEKKLDQLDKYEEELIKKDKAKKENRRGIQTICRMQGSITQSYFVLDQHEYKVARKIFYGQTQAGEVTKAQVPKNESK